MDKERFLQSGLLEQYVLGLTTEEENEEVERYARAFPEIQAEIDQLKNAVKQYAEAQIGTPKMSQVNGLGPAPVSGNATGSPAVSRPPATVRWIMAAGLLLFAVFGIYYFSEAKRSERMINELNNDLVAFKNDCDQERQQVQELKRQIAFFQHNRTKPLQLEGTQLAPDSKVRIFWNEQEKLAVLQVFSLPSHPADKQYQVWADIDGKMMDLGLIDSNNQQPQAIRCLPQASSLNITLEPAGGSEEPHVEHLYANVNIP